MVGMTGVTDDEVRAIALSLEGTVEKPSYGTPGFRVKDRLFARLHDQPGVLLVWLGSVEERADLIGREPAKFFTTDHYATHPSVLVRLSEVDTDEVTELLTAAWTLRSSGVR